MPKERFVGAQTLWVAAIERVIDVGPDTGSDQRVGARERG
jgi:hypothetical protein